MVSILDIGAGKSKEEICRGAELRAAISAPSRARVYNKDGSLKYEETTYCEQIFEHTKKYILERFSWNFLRYIFMCFDEEQYEKFRLSGSIKIHEVSMRDIYIPDQTIVCRNDDQFIRLFPSYFIECIELSLAHKVCLSRNMITLSREFERIFNKELANARLIDQRCFSCNRRNTSLGLI
jgi:hypothetical protein